jgi:hypothetical protein
MGELANACGWRSHGHNGFGVAAAMASSTAVPRSAHGARWRSQLGRDSHNGGGRDGGA